MRSIIIFFLILLSTCPFQVQSAEKGKRNAVEASFYTLNTYNFRVTNSFLPEVGYSRYIGNNVKVGAFYRYFKKNKATHNYYGLRAGFLPVPLFVKDENFNNNWELELSMNYYYEVYKGTSPEGDFQFCQGRFFSHVGVSRKLKNNFYVFSNIYVWNKRDVFIGIRYKF
ncbi:MAG: hypothetical protein CSA36_05415 [Draconibacterium sp.]|nr:MAG: hypothetical protein CSA36_05415 [Draconibacterium sp.]